MQPVLYTTHHTTKTILSLPPRVITQKLQSDVFPQTENNVPSNIELKLQPHKSTQRERVCSDLGSVKDDQFAGVRGCQHLLPGGRGPAVLSHQEVPHTRPVPGPTGQQTMAYQCSIHTIHTCITINN